MYNKLFLELFSAFSELFSRRGNNTFIALAEIFMAKKAVLSTQPHRCPNRLRPYNLHKYVNYHHPSSHVFVGASIILTSLDEDGLETLPGAFI